ncbi:hypothetical protein DICVIV_09064 [Dictyocaulus viviparus]|uniref:Uncharacterized protein n=1 Tax=Dictyocaulus viviparus TaxID=29172 RepID=A0A0D8XR98_DICVI|nr:hypothetical protein DICVIV_09064 [Dictyocaulus viviparus]
MLDVKLIINNTIWQLQGPTMADPAIDHKQSTQSTGESTAAHTVESADVVKEESPSIPVVRVSRIESLPSFGRRVSSVEAVKDAPPPKRQSVVVFETPDRPTK